MTADIVYNGTAMPDAYVGVAYAEKVPYHAALSVLTAGSITVGALPAGLAIGTAAGSYDLISGTPTAPGQFTFTVSLTDTAGAATNAMTINVWGADQIGMKDTEAPALEGALTEAGVVKGEWPVVQ